MARMTEKQLLAEVELFMAGGSSASEARKHIGRLQTQEKAYLKAAKKADKLAARQKEKEIESLQIQGLIANLKEKYHQMPEFSHARGAASDEIVRWQKRLKALYK